MAKCCKIRDIQPCEVCIYLHYVRKKLPFSPRDTNKILNLQTSQGCIFRILQNFATKLCCSANRRIGFLAVPKDFVLRTRV